MPREHSRHSHSHHSRSRSSGHHPHSTSSSRHHHRHHRRDQPARSEYSVRLHPSDDDFSFISPCAKYSLFIFNLVCWIVGGSCVGLGVWSFLEENSQLNRVQGLRDLLFRESGIFNISLVLVCFGVIVFSMSFAGCLGALRENLCLLKLYSLMLLLLFIGEIVLATVAFLFPNTLSHYFKDKLSREPLIKYRDDVNLQNIIDYIQQELHCCGISDAGYKDWSQNIYFNCSPTNPSPQRCSVPYSCCKDPRNIDSGLVNSMCGYNVQNTSSVVEVGNFIYTRGCIEATSEFVERHMNMVAGVCLTSALVQLLAIFVARSLQSQIMAQRARWM